MGSEMCIRDRLTPYHPLIIKLAAMSMEETNRPKVIEVSKILLDQAKIAEGENISDPAFYVAKLSDYILKAM